jgi:hypothetical protein
VRFFKFFLIVFTALLIILTLTYSARVSLINNLANTQLKLAQLTITCLDISLDSNLDVIVDKLCLQNPKADIEIADLTIRWQLSPKINLTAIDIRLAEIKGTGHLFSSTNDIPNSTNQQNNNNPNFVQLLSTILPPYIEQIRQFKLPLKTTIAEISYLPFTEFSKAEPSKGSAQNQSEMPYTANLSAIDNTFSFSLQNASKIAVVKAKLAKSDQGFAIALTSNLNLLKSFANKHQLPISAELQHALTANEISGSIDTLIRYQTDSLSMQNQLTDFKISSAKGIANSAAIKVIADLNFHSQLNLTAKEIALTFIKNNEISLQFNPHQLAAMLEKTDLSPAIVSILNDNPLANLTVTLQDNATLTLNKEHASLSNIDITAHNDEQVHRAELNNIRVSLPHSNISINNNNDHDSKKSTNQTFQTVVIKSFIINSELKLADIANFTAAPVILHLEGALDKTEKTTKISLNNKTLITINNIALTKQPNNTTEPAKAASTKNKVLIMLKSLTAKLTGNVQLLADNTLNIDLNVHNQASQVNIPKTLQLNSIDLFSQIKGNLDDIRINSTTQADGIALGTIVITGSVLSPNVQVGANKLQLTDLLSLNMQLPTEITLINGKLDYNLSGQIADLSDIENTPFDVSFAITSVSGEVDGIWLQELNWQQHFTLLAGKIATLPNVQENLTVELIETPTPISKLSINTNWTFNKSFKLSASKLKADILGGSFSIPRIQWPFEHGHSVDVQLNSVDLEQVLALEKEQGIVVTGNISGQIPVTFDGEKYSIKDGELHNVSNGLIQVIDNPAVAELKENNSQLQLAFDALQNLHYHQLSSAVSMGDDGYMLLETVIKGRNPDINNDVNLNLNLSYDLLGLLESLSITQRFEKSIIEGLQKN